MSQQRPTDVQVNTYAENYIVHGDQSKAWRATFPESKCKPESVNQKASTFHSIVKVQSRIDELKSKANEIANKSFTITVEQRLEWLKDITVAGLSTYADQQGNKRRESLTAARSAIETMNTMLGVSDDEEGGAKSLTINFSVSQAVKEVKVTNAKS